MLRASLQTVQQNAGMFHSFITAFCALNDQPAPPPLTLSNIPPMTVACAVDDEIGKPLEEKEKQETADDEEENSKDEEEENEAIE